MEKVSIYIIATQTGTMLSRLLKIVTKAKYNHVSISLDPQLEQMYSFGRKYPYNPIIAGLVKENPHRGTFKRFPNTIAKIISIEIDKKDYDIIKNHIESMYAHKDDYHYNLQGVAYGYFNKTYKKDNYYYCSEFVREVLIKGHVVNEFFFDDIVKPVDILEIANHKHVYEGLLKDYQW